MQGTGRGDGVRGAEWDSPHRHARLRNINWGLGLKKKCLSDYALKINSERVGPGIVTDG